MSCVILVMILSVFRRTNVALVMTLLMMSVVAAATLETTVNVFLIDAFNEAEIFGIELF